MLAEVTARSPSDAAGFQRLGRRISGIFDAFYPYTERPMMRPQVMLAMLPYLLQHRAMLDVNRLVNSCVRDPFLRQALSFHPLLIGGDPARTPALYALIVEFERRWGVHYAIGGTGALVDALGELLERLGGRIVLGADVERVLVTDGRAVGVQLADSTTHPADVVVSNADPGFTYGTLLGGEPRARPARARHAAGAAEHVPARALLRRRPHLARLAAGPPQHAVRAGPAGGHCAGCSPAGFPGARPERLPGVPRADDMFLYVHVPTRTDPSVAPPGCEALYVLVATPARPEPAADPQRGAGAGPCGRPRRAGPQVPSRAQRAHRRRARDRPRALPRRPQLAAGCGLLAATDAVPVGVVPAAQPITGCPGAVPGRGRDASGCRGAGCPGLGEDRRRADRRGGGRTRPASREAGRR